MNILSLLLLFFFNFKKKMFALFFFRFTTSVTCLDFATYSPNMLAAGFLDGNLYVLDASSLEKKVKKFLNCLPRWLH